MPTEEATPTALIVTINANSSSPHGITVKVDPAPRPQIIQDLQVLVGLRRSLIADGTYVGTFDDTGAFKINGPDEGGAIVIERQLVVDVTTLWKQFQACQGIDSNVEEACGALPMVTSSMIIKNNDRDGNLNLKRLSPGFLQIMVGCPTCDFMGFGVGTKIAMLKQLHAETTDPEKRKSFEEEIEQHQMAAAERKLKVPEITPSTLFVSGIDCQNPFAQAVNARLQQRVNALAPDLEKQTLSTIRTWAADTRRSIAAFEATLEERFPT